MRRPSNQIKSYTPDDITVDDIKGHYSEAEFYKKLDAMHDSYFEAENGIYDLLYDYDDSMPTHQQEYWSKQPRELLHLLRSHSKQLIAAAMRIKENVPTSSSKSSASEESNASEVPRAKRLQTLSKLKSDGVDKDAGNLLDKTENRIITKEPDADDLTFFAR